MYIYKIVTTESEKVYVGKTKRRIEERWREHLSKIQKGDSPLRRAMRKYGKETFSIHIVEKCLTLDELDEREVFWGLKLNALSPLGYSLKLGGKSTIFSEELIEKKRLANLGEKNPMFGRTGSLNYMFGKHHSEEAKKRMSLHKLGNPLSKEHILKKAASCAKTYFFLSPERIPTTIVNLAKFCRDSNGLLSHRNMKRVVKGERKQHKGWTLDTSQYRD